MIAAQLPLGLDADRRAGFDNYWPGANGAVLASLRRLAAEPAASWIALSGPAGAGKTHLVSATTRSCPGAILLRGSALDGLISPEDLAELASAPLVGIDDIEALFGNASWERALFRLLLELREQGGLLFSAAEGPRALQPDLPDLASRLTWGVHLRVVPLDDADKAAMLQERAREIGLALDQRTLAYMLTRLPRSAGKLLAWLERIAAASLAAQRRPSVALVRSLLEADKRAGHP